MTKKQNNSSKYLITPSLLNSWLYIFESARNVVESEKDEISLEDKKTLAMEKAKEDFLNALNRIPSEPNEYMKAGIEFEEECYKGNTCVSPIILGGSFQVVGKKNISVDGLDFLMYGRLDVLKAGVIYDIKRIWKYNLGKYKWSCQHQFYMELFPSCYKFEYLAYDGNKLHREVYYPYQCEEIKSLISKFLRFLEEENLLDIYKQKWLCK